MGRHGRRHAGVPTDAPPYPDARLVESLPGWGLFATAVAACFVGWAAGDWLPALGVAALGTGSTAVLWWTASAGDRNRRRGRQARRRRSRRQHL